MKLGFRSRLLLAAALPAVMVIVLLVIGFLNRHAADLDQALQDRGRASARQLGMAAEFPLFAGNVEALERLIAAARQGDAQILAVAVIERGGELRAATGKFVRCSQRRCLYADGCKRTLHLCCTAGRRDFAKPIVRQLSHNALGSVLRTRKTNHM